MMIQFTITMAVSMLISSHSFLFVQSFSYVTSSAFVTNTAAAAAAVASERIPARNIGSSSSGRSGNTVLSMAGGGGVRRRGLEQRRETITPTEEGMILYVKAGEDGTSVGDCPFSHYVRMVLEEKSLSYELRPTTHDTKPNWLLEYYDGQLPALRHQKECYIESDVIVAFLNYFFPAAAAGSEDPDQLHPEEAPDPVVSQTNLDTVEGSVLDDSFFSTLARYLKDVNDTAETEDAVIEKLGLLENHFKQLCRTTCTNSVCPSWCYLDGTQTNFDTKLDCRLLPQLYHLSVGIAAFKSSNTNKSEDTKDDADDDDDTDNDVPTNDNNNNPINLKQDYPYVYKYMMAGMERPSFLTTKYSSETIVWGWTNARKYQ